MALQIIESCVNCWACPPVCPSEAIYEAKPHFLIDPKKCTKCEGAYADCNFLPASVGGVRKGLLRGYFLPPFKGDNPSW